MLTCNRVSLRGDIMGGGGALSVLALTDRKDLNDVGRGPILWTSGSRRVR